MTACQAGRGATAIAPPASAQNAPEYRGCWVETFNTALGTRADIDRVIAAAVDSKANALFAQIRRRGDSWYLDSLEPLTQVAGVGAPGRRKMDVRSSPMPHSAGPRPLMTGPRLAASGAEEPIPPTLQ